MHSFTYHKRTQTISLSYESQMHTDKGDKILAVWDVAEFEKLIASLEKQIHQGYEH